MKEEVNKVIFIPKGLDEDDEVQQFVDAYDKGLISKLSTTRYIDKAYTLKDFRVKLNED
jgi:hypothetical protein